MSLAATIGEARVALRHHLGHLATKMIKRRLLRLRLAMSGEGLRQNDSRVFHPLAEQVLMDMQILDAYLTLTERNKANRR
jgi:hypothetical protein